MFSQTLSHAKQSRTRNEPANGSFTYFTAKKTPVRCQSHVLMTRRRRVRRTVRFVRVIFLLLLSTVFATALIRFKNRLLPPWDIWFFGVVSANSTLESCSGILTAAFHGLKVHYVTSQPGSDDAAVFVQILHLLKFLVSPSKTVVVVFRAEHVMFEEENADRRILQQFVTQADHKTIYIPDDHSRKESSQYQLCPRYSRLNMVATADVIRSYYAEYLQNQEAFGNQNNCFLRNDIDNLFFHQLERSIPRNEYAPLTINYNYEPHETRRYEKFFSRQYPLAYRLVISHLHTLLSSRDGYESLAAACGKLEPISSKSSTQRGLPTVYWINLEASLDRKQSMQRHMETLSTQFDFSHEKITATDAFSLARTLHLYHMPSWLSLSEEYGSWRDHVHDRYSFHEFACLVSHIKAIRRAYSEGDNIAVIAEDDMRFHTEFFDSFYEKVDTAPPDWEVLQLYTINPRIVSRLVKIHHSNFVRWYPQYWSTGAYIINRIGMQNLLETFDALTAGSARALNQKQQLSHVLVADEFLFFHAHSYTATYHHVHAVDAVATKSTVQNSGIDVSEVNLIYSTRGSRGQRPCRVLLSHPAPKSILLYTTARVTHVEVARTVLRRMRSNVMALKSAVEHIECVIIFIAPDEDARRIYEETMHSNEHPYIHVIVRTRARRFNKFWFIRTILSNIEDFDKFLLLDSDLEFSGFPVQEFFEHVRDAVIAGAIRRTTADALLTNAENVARQWFAAFSYGDWQNFLDAGTLKVTFIELYFAMFDSSFARWFFSKILEEKYFHFHKDNGSPRLESDFGPDIMWCGAAAEWLKFMSSNKVPCLLSLLPLHHADERQIETQSVDVSSRRKKARVQKAEREPLANYKNDFSEWFQYSQEFRDFLGGEETFDGRFVSYMQSLAYARPEKCFIRK